MKPSFSDVRDQLRFVTSKASDLDLSVFPDFLIIGPQRTGTTWLHRNLKEHPQVFVPFQKEIYYFNNLPQPTHHPADLPPVEPDLQWYLEKFHADEEWMATREKRCLQRFGEPPDLQIRGESTATYAVDLPKKPRIIDEITAPM